MARKTAAAAVKDQPALFTEGERLARETPQTAKAKPKAVVQKTEAPKPEVAKPAVNKGNLTIVKNNPSNTLALIADALKDPNFKPENMRLVLDMHKEMVTEQARLDFVADFIAMKAELPVINQDGKIEILEKGSDGKRVSGRDRVQQATPYATFENISRVIDPILQKHNFALSFATEPSPDGTRLLVKGLLDHASGHQRTTMFPLPAESSGSKNNAQAWGSSFSYGKRYAAIALLNIRTAALEDRDLDGNKPKVTKAGKPQTVEGKVLVDPPADDEQIEVCSEEQIAAVREAIEANGVPDKTFLNHFKIEKVSQLPAADFRDALAACKVYGDKKRAAG